MAGLCDLNAMTSDFTTWGKCLTEGVFFGNALVAAIVVFAFIAYIMWMLHLRAEAALLFGIGFAMFFMATTGILAMSILYLLGIVAIAVVVILGIVIKFAKK